MTSPIKRRRFLQTGLAAASALAAAPAITAAQQLSATRPIHVASNQYPWMVYLRREGRDFGSETAQALAEVKESGLDGFEPLVGSAAQIETMGPLMQGLKLEMRSIYMGAALHEEDAAKANIEKALAVAESGKKFGCQILVVNPQPLGGGDEAGKTDDQIRTQARMMDELGRQLREAGVTLAYHYHTPGMQHAAREFHHMMCGTDPANVSLCFDVHWVYRGADNSEVACFDIAKLYASRIVEYHLRQSIDHVWSESFGDGDIDYAGILDLVRGAGDRSPHIVLEQAVEGGTPQTMSTVEAFKKSVAYTRSLFG